MTESLSSENGQALSANDLKLVRLVIKGEDDVWFVGYVVGDEIRVIDVLTDGRSSAELTGCRRRLRPMKFEYFHQKNIDFYIEPHDEPLFPLEPPERYPTPEEVLRGDF